MGVAHGFFSFWISPTVDWRSKCGYIIKYVQCVTHTTFASLSWMYTESYRKMQKYTFWGYFNWTPHKKSIFVNRTSGLYWSGYGKLKRSYVESDIVFIFAQVLSLSENDYTQIAIPPTPKWFTELNIYAYLTSILRGWFLIMISWKWLLKIVCTEDGSKVIVFWAFVCAFFKTWFISVWTTCTYNKYLCWWKKKL